MIKCEKCGSELEPNAKFCTNCGESVAEKAIVQREDFETSALPIAAKDTSFSLFSFSGCISRKTYWAVSLGSIIILIVFAQLVITFSISSSKESSGHVMVATVMGLLVLIFGWIALATSIKRFRDANFSPWLALINIIPYLGYLITLILNGFFPTVEQDNKYCNSKNNLSTKAIRWIYIIVLVLYLLLLLVPIFFSPPLPE